MQPEALTRIIYKCVEEINGQLPPDQRMPRTTEAIVLGEGGVFDSLSIINLLVLIEEKVAAEFGVFPALVEALVDTDETSATVTIGDLIDRISAGRPA